MKKVRKAHRLVLAVVLAVAAVWGAASAGERHPGTTGDAWVFFDRVLDEGRFVHVALSPVVVRKGRCSRMLSVFMHGRAVRSVDDGDGPFRAGWAVDGGGSEPVILGPAGFALRIAPVRGTWQEVATLEDLAVVRDERDR